MSAVSLLLLLHIGAADGAYAPDDAIARLGTQLAELRTEVDAAAHDVAQQRQLAADEVATWERRKRELQAQLAQHELNTEAFTARMRGRDQSMAAQVDADDQSRAPLRAALQSLRSQVARVPFRMHARRERIDAIERVLPTMTVMAASALVWPVLVDEAKLLHETGRARQAIELSAATGTEKLLVEVAHVGPMVFWKSKDGRVGMSTLSDGDGRFVELQDAEQRQRLSLLFDAMRRDAWSGTMWVPNPLREVKP